MLDHIFLTVSDVERSIGFYTAALAPLGITNRHDFSGKDGPPGHPDLKGFGANGRIFFWLRSGLSDGGAAHVGFVANSKPTSMPPMPQPLPTVRPTMARRAYGPITTRAITRPACSIRMATA